MDFSQGHLHWQSATAVVIFMAAYVLMATERWNRSYVALSGAGIMLILGIVPWFEAWKTIINWPIFGLLAGLYVIAGFMNRTGIVPFAALTFIRLTNANLFKMLVILCFLAAIGAALFDGIFALIILVPFTLRTTRVLKISPMPFVAGLILSANLGGMATLVGNLSNRVIGSAVNLSFNQFLIMIGPLAVILIAIVIGVIYWFSNKNFIVTEKDRYKLLFLNPADYLMDRKLVLSGSIIGLLILAAFILQATAGLNSGVIASIGALLVILVNYKETMQTFKTRDYRQLWQSIIDSQVLFILGLLLMTSGLVHTGIINFIAARVTEITQGSLSFAALLLLWVTGVGSSLLDSIPYVAVMLPVLKDTAAFMELDAAQTQTLWWALAIGAGIGGGGTLLGSSANLIAAGLAEEEGCRISYKDYLKWAGPLTFFFLILASCFICFILL